MLEEEDQAVAEEEPHALEVDRRATHQLARLVSVVEAEREADELRVHGLPHVELDRERLFARDQPAARHHQGAREAQQQHDRDEPFQPAELVLVQRGDDASRQEDRDQRRGLRADGQQDRDDQRELVRPEEGDQP